jgi:hypothetical protein
MLRLPFQFGQVLGVNSIGPGNIRFIPSIVPSLIAADQKNCRSRWVEGIKDAKGLSPALDAKLSHFRMR